jgi:flagellar protein FliL
MADEEIPNVASKGKKKLLIIIIAAVVLIVVAGGAAYFLLGSSEPSAAADSKQEQKQEVEKAGVPVRYVSIPQPFVFNVTGDNRDRLVQIKVQLMVRGSDNEELARYHSPLVESSLLSTFASATVEQLRSPTGRIELRDKATEDIRTALNRAVGKPVIERVLFTDFVMQ